VSKIHNCETCGQKVVVGGEGTTHFYIGKESELAQQAMIDEVIGNLDKAFKATDPLMYIHNLIRDYAKKAR